MLNLVIFTLKLLIISQLNKHLNVNSLVLYLKVTYFISNHKFNISTYSFLMVKFL